MPKLLSNLKLSLLLATALCVRALGDTLVLTSGEKVEGKIIKETDAEVTIETKAGGIVDERIVKRSEIASVGKASPDEAPWQTIRGFKLSDNSMTAAQYDAFIGPMKAFVTQFGDSKHKPEVEKMLADFEAEKQRVSNGERKLSGKWLSKEEVQRESYQINAAITLNYMRDQGSRSDLIGALNTYDLLEKQYPGSRSYLEGVEYAKRLIPALKQQAETRLARIPAENAEREKAVQLARVGEKAQIQAELEREKQNAAAAVAQAKQQNRKWPPFVRNEEALQQIVQAATEEARRLGEMDLSKPRESLRAVEQAKAALAKKDVPAAEESIKKAEDLWSENELLVRLNQELATAKETASAEATTAEKNAEEASAQKTADKPPTAPEGADGNPAAAAEDEEKSSNPLFRIVIALVLAGVAYAGWKAYSNVRKKANEVVE